MSKEPDGTITLFYSYSHRDQDLRNELEKHLSVLSRSGTIANWHDRRIGPGLDWSREIDEHINSAKIILLLISSDFLASDYCHEIEMKRAIERHKSGEARVIPVILRPVDWKGADFSHLQALPKDGKPITTWSNADEALRDVAEGIRHAIVQLNRSTVSRTSQLAPESVKAPYVLQAAAPKRMPAMVSRDVVAMISTHSAPGLQEVLTHDRTYTPAHDDVKSQPFLLDFPDPGLLSVKVRLWAPDFDPKLQETDFRLDNGVSSQPLVFFIAAWKPGTDLLLKLDLLVETQLVTTRMLRTNAIEAPPPAEPEPQSAAPPVPRRSPRAPQGWTVVVSTPLTVKFVDAYSPVMASPSGDPAKK